MINFNFDGKGLENYSNKLIELNRSAFPVAIRGALNDTAFDNKKRTMPASAQRFVNRQKNFFIANSKVQPAVGFSINDMKAISGFYENKLINQSTNFSVKNLEEQEEGGQISHKSFIPLPGARTGGKGNVRSNARLKAIKNQKIINSKNANGANWAQRAIKSVVFAGVGGLVLVPGKKGSVLWRVKSIRRSGNVQFRVDKLYSFNKNRVVRVHKTDFMKESGLKSEKSIQAFYIKQAQRQIEKYYGKK